MAVQSLRRVWSDRVSFVLFGLGILMGILVITGVTDIPEGVSLTEPVVAGNWMAWTWAGVLFFGVIGSCLLGMIVWGILAPEVPRRGMLGIETTPGDRLFISLLGSAFIHLAWLGLLGPPLWGALALGLIWAGVVFRWV